MAVLKQRLYRKNQAEGYDLIHLETSADIVKMPDSNNTVSDVISSINTAVSALATDPYVLDTDNISRGAIVSWAGYEWRVVHKDSLYMYMITKDLLERLIQFGSDNKYATSNIAKHAQSLEDYLPTAATKHLGTITIRDRKAKVFIPEAYHLGYNNTWFRGYTYFSPSYDAGRIANYDGTAWGYWTSSSGGTGKDVIVVSSSGKFSINADPTHSYGFRPCVAYKR